MRPYLLAECNWKDIKDRSIELAILPWGAIEAHNYHLPYSSDIIESYHIALLVHQYNPLQDYLNYQKSLGLIIVYCHCRFLRKSYTCMHILLV